MPVSEHWDPKSYSNIHTVCELVTKSEGKKTTEAGMLPVKAMRPEGIK